MAKEKKITENILTMYIIYAANTQDISLFGIKK